MKFVTKFRKAEYTKQHAISSVTEHMKQSLLTTGFHLKFRLQIMGSSTGDSSLLSIFFQEVASMHLEKASKAFF